MNLRLSPGEPGDKSIRAQRAVRRGWRLLEPERLRATGAVSTTRRLVGLLVGWRWYISDNSNGVSLRAILAESDDHALCCQAITSSTATSLTRSDSSPMTFNVLLLWLVRVELDS